MSGESASQAMLTAGVSSTNTNTNNNSNNSNIAVSTPPGNNTTNNTTINNNNNNITNTDAGAIAISSHASNPNSNPNSAPNSNSQVSSQMGQHSMAAALNYQHMGLPQSQIMAAAAAHQRPASLAAAMTRQQHMFAQNQGLNSNQSIVAALRSGASSRFGHIGQLVANRHSMLYGAAAAAAASQMGLTHHHHLQQQQQSQQQQQQQQQQQLARAAAAGGIIPQTMFPAQPSQLPPYFSQHQFRPKQSQLQNSQFPQPVSTGQSLQNFQALGMMGSLGSASQNRMNNALSYAQQTRMGQGTLRSPPSGQPASPQASLSSPQKLQPQNLQRVSSFGSVNTQISGISQGNQSLVPSSLSHSNQWSKIQQSSLPSIPSPTYQIQQQRQQQAQLQQTPASPSQQLVSHPQQLSPQQNPQQLHQEQIQQSLQGQMMHYTNPAVQTPSTPTSSQSGASAVNVVTSENIPSQATDGTIHILGKRSIQDLVSQVDPQAILDPDIEDMLLELADDYINSVTMFACTLAKHRKSVTLDSKDVLLHLEKNWKLSIPGISDKDPKKQKQSIQDSVTPMQMEGSTSPHMQTEVANINNCTGSSAWNSNSGAILTKAMHNSSMASPFLPGQPAIQRLRRF